jgi:hypothetical protein
LEVRQHLASILLAFMMFFALPALGDSAPKPLLFLWEFSGWGHGPAPSGLRFVIYDDGRLILTDETLQATRDGSPTLYTKMIGVDSAKATADAILQQLANVPKDAGGYFGMTDQGSTVIQVWDSQNARFIRYNAYGHPCRSVGRDFANPLNWSGMNRRETDSGFLKVCDDLSQYSLDDTDLWEPEAVWITFVAKSDAPLLTFEWPEDWAPLPDPVGQDVKLVCMTISNQPSEMTKHLIDMKNADLIRFRDAGTKTDGSRWWILNYWELALPGEVDLADSVPGARPLARGPCENN